MSENANNGSRRFAYGVFFLTVSNLLTKICGLFLKVPLTNTLGDTGMAYFNLAYAVYKWFYMISTAGLPVAAAILTAKYAAESDSISRAAILRRIRNVTLGAFVLLGLLGSLCMFFGAPLFAFLQGAQNAASSIAVIAPALLFICITSALRGWYQGLECQMPTAISQVAEAVGKLLCGLGFAAYALKRGEPIYTVAAYAAAGLTVGCLLGMTVMLIAHPIVVRKNNIGSSGSTQLPRREILSSLWQTALPVTLSASVMSLCDMLDSMFVLRRLCGAGMDMTTALGLYGSYTALAVPMFNLPPILIYPLTTALIPVISAVSKERERCRRIISGALSVTAMIALPCAAGMGVMAEPILRLLYRADLAQTGAPLLSVLSIAVFFLSFSAMTNAILQAVGVPKYALYSMILGGAVKLISSWILTGQATVGILGTPISTVLCYAVMALCNLYFVMKTTGAVPRFVSMLWRPTAASFVCAVTAKWMHMLLSSYISDMLCTVISIALGGVMYFSVMILLGGISEDVLSLFSERWRERKKKIA